MSIQVSTTPASLTKDIAKFCKTVSKKVKPIYVPVQPIPGYTAHFCWNNVQRHMEEHGGGIQYGWIIWEMPGLLIEAEFHAVWVTHEGQFVDITEKDDRETQILFLPDESRKFNGRLIDNIRYPLIDNVVTRRIINRNRALFELRSKYYNDKSGIAEVPFDEMMALERRFQFK